jgi:predicted hydrocarbon binding protein
VVRIKDIPGALNSVLEILRDRVDIIGSISYGLGDGSAVWSGFVRALSKADTEPKLKNIVKKSPMVIESIITGSDRGLLADSYHSGIEYGPSRAGVIMPFVGIARIFNHLTNIFGTGGETILFQEGSALGKASGQYINDLLGPGRLDWKVGALAAMYRTIGWGITTLKVDRPRFAYSVLVRDCFECVEGSESRKACWFLRGHLVSTLSTLSGAEFDGTETKCRLRGDPYCEFCLTRKK